MWQTINNEEEKEWIFKNNEVTHPDFISLPKESMSSPYPKSYWNYSNNKIRTGLFLSVPPQALSNPLPAAIWEIDLTIRKTPFMLLQLDLPELYKTSMPDMMWRIVSNLYNSIPFIKLFLPIPPLWRFNIIYMGERPRKIIYKGKEIKEVLYNNTRI